MKIDTLQKAVALAEKIQQVFVATADMTGLSHIASVKARLRNSK